MLRSAAIEELRTAHPDRPITIAYEGDCAGQWGATRIEQLVSNLVGNAVQHGYRGTPVDITIDGNQAETVIMAFSIAARQFQNGNGDPFLIR